MGLTEKEEALLFARQFGFSSRLTPGEELRAMDVGGDLIGKGFVRATKTAGFDIDYTQQSAKRRLGCVATAFKEYQKVGERMYIDALRILGDAWDGDPESLRSETVTAMCRFVELYDEEYDRERLVRRLKKEDPIAIYRNGRDMGNAMAGYKKYLFHVLFLLQHNADMSREPHVTKVTCFLMRLPPQAAVRSRTRSSVGPPVP